MSDPQTTFTTLTTSELEAFLAEHGDRIYTYLCILCKSEDQAADALQNACIKFMEQVGQGKVRRETASQYLATIAKNDFLNRKRKEAREVPLADDESDAPADARADRERVTREIRLVLFETLEDPDVPPDVAAVMRLRFLNQADVSKICSETGRSQATVYRLMEKALSILAEACRKAGLHLEDLQ
ncbi:MAG: sigma-70 family RNA polymerase sigma factor [bacterium]|nr:sigma-70 family RNA polymerase sigma factor [bacterium]